MNVEMKSKVDLMAENFQELKGAFAWDSNLIKHFGALITATRESRVDIDRAKEIKHFIKEQTAWTSFFRGSNEMIFAMLLQGESDYQGLFQKSMKVYEDLKKQGFNRGTYLPLAAYVIAKNAEESRYEDVYVRMEQIYKKMKNNHFWLTSQDDYMLAAVLASSELDVDHTSQDMEACYQLLNQAGLYKGNELQNLTHVLSLGEETAEVKCENAIKIQKILKASPSKLRYQGLASLGVLALVTDQPEQIAAEVIEVYDYLYKREGYGFWGIESSMRAILSATIVSDYYADQMGGGLLEATLANSITAILIAQQTAMIAAIAASSAAASASASS